MVGVRIQLVTDRLVTLVMIFMAAKIIASILFVLKILPLPTRSKILYVNQSTVATNVVEIAPLKQ